MPRNDFTWDNFDDETVCALAYAFTDHRTEDGAAARSYLNADARKPDDTFVYNTQKNLVKYWLTKKPEIAKRLVEMCLKEKLGPGTRSRSAKGRIEYLKRFRKDNEAFRRLLLEELLHCGEPTCDDEADGDSGIRPLRRLIPSEQPISKMGEYPYQKEAWSAMSGHLDKARRNGVFAGLLVMPTGSGKTFTAVRWLTENHLNKGGRVLWIAHRHDLLEQAAFAFYHAAYLATELPALRVRIVSGSQNHSAASMIGPDRKRDNVIIWSIQSAARSMKIAERLLANDDVFLVVDEAHHAPARKTYRKLFDLINERPRRRVLGLTATPTRTIEDERPVLARLFDDRKIYEVGVRELIEEGYLARPYPEVVRTNIDAEKGITTKDEQHILRFHELSPAWEGRLAKLTKRNQTIVQQYLKKRKRYGKTLVFAVNILHAKLLCNQFRKAGVDAEYVASDRSSNENHEIINRFRAPRSKLKVLINVEILTEGVDVPSIQTVFLTRPTRSEIRLRQMIGRAMRGPQIPDGTKRAYLVSFEDHWSRFSDWESPFDLVQDIIPEDAKADTEKPAVPKPIAEAIPWDLIQAAADEIRRHGLDTPIEWFEAVPHGWYILERDNEASEVRQIIHVYQHQFACWQTLIDRLWPDGDDNPDGGKRRPSRRKRAKAQSVDNLYEDYFADCDAPRPGKYDVDELLAHKKAAGDRPEYHAFADRKDADPYAIAEEIIFRNLGPTAKNTLIKERYELKLAQAIYSSLREFHAAVDEAIFAQQNPKEALVQPKAEVVFEPPTTKRLRHSPTHNLELLLEDACTWGAESIGEKHLSFDDVEIEWTSRPFQSHFAVARWEKGEPRATGRICVNCQLNTPDVSEETVRFLVWHEYLHLYLQEGHTRKFRELEMKWKGDIEANYELDTLHERFDLKWK